MFSRAVMIIVMTLAASSCRMINPQYQDTSLTDDLNQSDHGGDEFTFTATEENEESFGLIDSNSNPDDSSTSSDLDTDSTDSGITAPDSTDTTTDNSTTSNPGITDTDIAGCTPYLCLSTNPDDSFNDDRSVPDNVDLVAHQFVAEGPITVIRAELLTGEVRGESTLSLWTNDDMSPGIMLTSGSWNFEEEVMWQGADFELPYAFEAGEAFWLVWKPISGSQSSRSSDGTTVPTLISGDNGQSWVDAGSIPSIRRIYCCG